MRTLGTLLLSMALFTLACGGTTSDGVYRTPIVERGVCATILMPGQTMPMPEPGETPGCQGGHASIAGGGVVEESQKTTKAEPHPVVKAIGAPFAVLLFPFKLAAAGAGKLGDLVSDDAEEVPMDPRLRERQAQVAKADPQAAHERAQLSALERELEQRGGKTRVRSSGPALEAGSARSSAPGGAAPAGARPSIAAELAALRGGPAGGAVPLPVPSVSAPAPRASPLRAPERAAALPPADRVLDRDGDGRPDHWIHLSQGRPLRELFDDDGDGAPDRTVLRDPASGRERRVEEDRNGDGIVDLVAEYEDGELARVRRDTDFDGSTDTWSFYRAGRLTREESDPDGDGFRNRVTLYEDGRLVSEREDRDADGRVDRLTRYDAEQRVIQRDEDQDGDGLVDARSYYENGRLVRRELVSESQSDPIDDEEDLSSAAWSSEAGEARP